MNLYKILLTSKLYCGSLSSLYCHPPTCNAYPIAILLHAHAQYTPPPTDPHPPFMPYTIQYRWWQYRDKAKPRGAGLTHNSRLLYSSNRLNLNRMPYCMLPLAYSICMGATGLAILSFTRPRVNPTYGADWLAAGYLERCPAATYEPLWFNSLCSGTWASFDSEFRRFDHRKLEVESLRRTGHLWPQNFRVEG